jgi:N utilization substance protein B
MSRSKSSTRGGRRGAARLAAVQALYQMELSGVSAEQALSDHAARSRDAEGGGETTVEADAEFLGDLVRGVDARGAEIDEALGGVIAQGWALARLEVVLRAILRAGAWELLARDDIDPPVTIDEYVEIAKDFFAGREPSMVNGVLDKLAGELRQEEAAQGAENGPENGPERQ